jgi:hypothetical protein
MPSVEPANVRALLSTLVSARLAIETYALAVAAKLTADTLSRVAPVVLRRLLGQCERIYKRAARLPKHRRPADVNRQAGRRSPGPASVNTVPRGRSLRPVAKVALSTPGEPPSERTAGTSGDACLQV